MSFGVTSGAAVTEKLIVTLDPMSPVSCEDGSLVDTVGGAGEMI